MSATIDSASRRIRAAFDAIGVDGTLHAVDLASGREVGVDADRPVVLASVFKVPLVIALHRLGEAGALDLAAPVEVPVQRTKGATGISAMQDPVRMSLRDLAYLALAISDTAASDVIHDVVGDAPLAALLSELGLHETHVPQRCRDMTAAIVADARLDASHDLQRRVREDPSLVRRLSVRDPRHTNASTAREMTRLLRAIWEDRAATPESCAAIRAVMAQQVWPHRLTSGFTDGGFGVAGKTGTLPGIRNEIGVVERPDGTRAAVAVFTVADSVAPSLPQADRLIGTAARIAVDALQR